MARACVAVSVALVAVVAALWLSATGEVPIAGVGAPGVPVLGEGGYDITPVEAPDASGPLLSFLTWILTSTRIGPPVRRLLLNNNNIHMLRELSAQAPELPPMYYPMARMEPAFHAAEAAQAATTDGSLAHALSTGVRVTVDAKDGDDSAWSHPDPLQAGPDFSGVWSCEDYHDAYAAGATTPTEVADRVLAGIQELERLRAFSSVLPDDVRKQAVASAARWAAGEPLGMLDGVPVAVKDMLTIRGHPTFDGMQPTAERRAAVEEDDDIMVERLREAGAILVGLTVMTEGGVTPLGYAPFFGGPHNPYNQSHYPGGSSGGSAVAVATGLMPIAIGFDGGGSIRIPASLSGTVGFGASFGRVPFHPERAATTMIKTGVLASTVRDAALVYAAVAPTKPGHFYTKLYGGTGPPAPHLAGFRTARGARLDGVRLGIFRAHYSDADPNVLAACDAAVAWMEARGATVVEISIPHMHWLSLAHSMKISSEFAMGFDLPYHREHAGGVPLEANTRLTVGLGATMSALEVLAGQRLRAWAFHYVRQLYKEHGLTAIVTPTTPMVAPAIPAAAFETGEYNVPKVVRLMRMIFLGNLLGMPAVTVPVGYDEATSLPFSLQLMGTHWSEAELLRLGRVLDEEFLGAGRRRPGAFVDILGHAAEALRASTSP